MPRSKANQEIEIKLRVKDEIELRRRLRKLLAQQASPRTYESNTLYDDPSRSLTRHGQLVRIRLEQPCRNDGTVHRTPGNRAILTYKGPSQSLRNARAGFGNRKKRRPYKIREELEVTVDDAELMARVLFRLGLRPAFRYEKFRTTFILPGIRNLKIEVDDTPVGLFLELEGSRASIGRAAKLLGYIRSDYITQTYGALYIAACRRTGTKPGHTLFKPTKKMR